MNILDIPTIVPKVNGARRVNLLDAHASGTYVAPIIEQEAPMPRGVYERKPKDPQAAKVPKLKPAAKKSSGQYSAVLAELRARRDQIDAAIAAVEALG